MDQSRALNALAPFLALAPSATSPRAAADLITQATSAPNTYVFAELLSQPNIRSLSNSPDTLPAYRTLELFACGTWTDYKAKKAAGEVPELSSKQAEKLKLLSLLSIAAKKAQDGSSHLSYPSLCTALDLASPLELEQLVTTAIYANLLTGTLNPSTQTCVLTSVAPLRDPAPGSLATMLSDLSAWSSRCDTVLADLQSEIAKVQAAAEKRAKTEEKRERQVKAAGGDEVRGTGGGKGKGKGKHEVIGDDEEDGDGMDVDEVEGGSGGGLGSGGGKKRGAGGLGGIMGRMGGRGRSAR